MVREVACRVRRPGFESQLFPNVFLNLDVRWLIKKWEQTIQKSFGVTGLR